MGTMRAYSDMVMMVAMPIDTADIIVSASRRLSFGNFDGAGKSTRRLVRHTEDMVSVAFFLPKPSDCLVTIGVTVAISPVGSVCASGVKDKVLLWDMAEKKSKYLYSACEDQIFLQPLDVSEFFNLCTSSSFYTLFTFPDSASSSSHIYILCFSISIPRAKIKSFFNLSM
ncbi:unnamed protein product [Arabis nemorensis]|uniref:Uncharacterized protein n=1 Tax=Arabis nemorensis TaxID=586526 RepID=A0A565AXE7_9BRAS|nr:unnamed protein product [Arabis nemorensis]